MVLSWFFVYKNWNTYYADDLLTQIGPNFNVDNTNTTVVSVEVGDVWNRVNHIILWYFLVHVIYTLVT